MELHEVFVQGVSRFLTPYKFSLTPGYNVVYGANESGKTALAQALVATFDDRHAIAAAGRLKPIVPQEGTQRYGALFGHNGRRYRLLRDLSGALNLARLNSETQKFEPVARDSAGLIEFLQDEVDFPIDGLYAVLGLTDRFTLAPGVSAGAAASLPAPASRVSDYDSQMFGADEVDEDEGLDQAALLKKLKHELNILSSVDDIQFRVDGLQQKRFTTESRLSKFKEIATRLEVIEKRSEEIKPIEGFTPELESRVGNLDQQEAYQRQKLHSLDEEIAQLEKRLDLLEPKHRRKFHKDPFFIGGVVAALLGFVLPFVTPIVYFALLGLAGLGWSIYLAVFVYPKVEVDFKEVDRKYRQKCAEEEKVKRDFDTAMASIKGLVKALQTLDAKDLLKVAEEWRNLKSEGEALLKQREALIEEFGEPEKVANELKRQEAEIALFEEELRNAGAITRDANQLQNEIQRIEAYLASGGQANAVAASSDVALSAGQATGGGLDVGALLQTAATIARRDLDDMVAVAGEKLNTYLRALTNAKLGPAELDASGQLSIMRAEFPNNYAGLGELSEGSRDTVLIALRFALLEVILPVRPFPVIFDDPFALLDDQRQAVVAKALKRLAGLAQVVHFTGQKSFLALADNKVEIK